MWQSSIATGRAQTRCNIDDINDGDFPVDIEEEEIVITFDEPQPPDVIKRAILKETKRQ